MVKRGQLVARIDPPTYIARVDQAQAEHDIAKANILASQVQLERSRADLETGKAQLAVLGAQIVVRRPNSSMPSATLSAR